MSSTLLVAAPALGDLDVLFDMIAKDSPARAARFIMRIRARCERLEAFRHLGHERPELAPFYDLFPHGLSSCFTASMATLYLLRASSTVGEISARSTSSSAGNAVTRHSGPQTMAFEMVVRLTIIAATMLDRYLHHRHVENLNGDSCRLRSHNRGLAGTKSQKASRVGPA